MNLKLKKIFRTKQKDPRCSVVVVAAGSSERMGGDKMLMTLGAKPVIIRTLMAFQKSPLVEDIVVVTKREKIMALADMIKLYDISKVSQVISGGATRMESSLAGVSAVRKGAKLIAIHDGARPLVSQELIERVASLSPDLIVITGDLIDRVIQLESVPALAQGLAAIAPTYYVTGNHEWSIRQAKEIKILLQESMEEKNMMQMLEQ